MFEQLTDYASVARVKSLMEGCRKPVITCHVSPDGDAIGSCLALMHVLRHMGKDAAVVTPDTPPRLLCFLPGIRSITIASAQPEKARRLFYEADLVIGLDFNTLMRIDKLSDAFSSATAPKVLIDHHLEPETFTDVLISHPEKSSACYVLFLLLQQIGWSNTIDHRVAECIYTGMMTDTGGFTYNSNDPGLYLAIADLMKRGIDKDRIYRQVFNTNSEARVRLCAYALYQKMTIYPGHQAAVIALSRQELDDFGYAKGDTESLVNQPLSIPEVTYSVFLRQDEPEFVKVSCRSKGRFPVNRLCQEHFGGGGHANAAGGEFYGSLENALQRLTDAMPAYDKYLTTNRQ